MNLDHQDWNVQYVYLSKKTKEKQEKNSISKIPNKENKMDKQIEEGNMKVKKTSADIGKQIQQKRNELKLSQKDLASKVNVLPKVIVEIESGKAKHNPQLIVKIKKQLQLK